MTDMPARRPADAAPATTSRSLLIALLVAGAFFMENLDGTVIATALPQMAVSFGVRPVDLNIGMSAYLLTLAVFIPISGWISDRLRFSVMPTPICACSPVSVSAKKRLPVASAMVR